MRRMPPSLIASLMAVGTALIGALLAFQYSQKATVAGADVKNLLYAFLLVGLFTVTALLFSKGEQNAGSAKQAQPPQEKEAA
jgi:hypothetical protein